MQRFVSSRLSAIILLLLLAVGYAGLHGAQLSTYLSTPENLYQGEPLLTTPDGYFYLRQAADVSVGTYSGYDALRDEGRPATAPLLASGLAAFTSLTGFKPLTAAFYASPILAFLLIPIMGFWGSSVGRLKAGLAAGFVASCSQAWFSRVLMGAFDTDSLILPLLLSALVFLSLPLTRSIVRWFCFVLGAGCSLAVLYFWWPQGSLVMCAMVIGVYAASGFLPQNDRLERYGKLVLFLLGSIFLAFMMLGSPSGELGIIAQVIKSHLNLAVKAQASTFAETGGSVSELASVSFLSAVRVVAGHWLVMICSALGYAAFTWRHPKSSLMVGGPCLALGMASIWAGTRFLMFLAPCFGIGVVFFALYIVAPLLQRWKHSAGYVALICIPLLVGPAIYRCVAFVPAPIHNTNSAGLASVIDKVASKEAFVWNWWGPGYMQAYFGKRAVLVDGGKQQPQPVYIASVPFAASDPAFARHWIKFFSVHRRGLSDLAPLVGGKAKAADFLKKVFSAPATLPALQDEYNLPTDRDWKKWLFPERETYIILQTEMLVRGTWNEFGRWDPLTQTGPKVQVHMVPSSRVRLDRKNGLAFDPDGNGFEYSKLYFVHPKNLSHDPVRQKGPVAMLFWQSPYFYTLEQEYFNCLAYRLLFVYPDSTPGFKLVWFNPYVGGLWRVE